MEQTLAEALEVPFSQRTPEYERYLVNGELGEGGMGKVFRAYDQKLNRGVAIKVMVPDEGRDEADLEDLKARFYREAKIVAALHHPNVLQMLDYSGPDAPVPFIVTELLEGTDLDELIDQGPLPEKTAMAIGYYLAMGLGHAHGLQIVHRDVKPRNVFIERDGRVVLIDFGVAKGVRATNTRVTLMASRTRVVGTTIFSSPEQVRTTAPPGPASDLFSLGSVLYFAMSQVLPFGGKTVKEILEKLVNSEPLDLRRLVPCSDQAWTLIQRLLSKAPDQRPSNQEAVAALKQLGFDSRFPSLQDQIASYVTSFETGGVPMSKVSDVGDAPTAQPTAVESRVVEHAPLTESLVDTSTGRERTDRNDLRHTQMQMKGDRTWLLPVVAVVVLLGIGGVLAFALPSSSSSDAVAKTDAKAPEPLGKAKLRVLVKPWGKVSIDGVERGTTPAFRVIELPVGEHVVFVQNPSFGTREVKVVLPEPNREESLLVDFTTPP